MNINEVKQLFLHPKEFLFSSKVEKEKKYTPAMFLFVSVSLISILLTFLASIASIYVYPSAFEGSKIMLISGVILQMIFSIGITFASLFVLAGITHLGVLILRGKQGYFNTYKPIAYASVIGAVYQIFSAIVIFVTSFFLLPIPTEQNFDIFSFVAKNPGYIGYFAAILLIGLASFIHTLYAEIIGLAKYQKMTKTRAFWSLVLVPLMLIILIILIMALVVFLVYLFN